MYSYSFLFLIDDKFKSQAELRTEQSHLAAPKTAFPDGGEQHDTVGNVTLQFQRDRPSIDEGVLCREQRAVGQLLVAPVYRFITGKGGAADGKEEGLGRIGEEFQEIAALQRELGRGICISRYP